MVDKNHHSTLKSDSAAFALRSRMPQIRIKLTVFLSAACLILISFTKNYSRHKSLPPHTLPKDRRRYSSFVCDCLRMCCEDPPQLMGVGAAHLQQKKKQKTDGCSNIHTADL